MNNQPATYLSRKHRGCYYQFINCIGKGGSGEVYTVLLKDRKTDKVKKLLAGKIVLESWLLNKNTKKRRENLRREIEILQLADKVASVTLVEQFQTFEGTILIQDYINGGSLLSMMNDKGRTLKEAEAQNVIRLLA